MDKEEFKDSLARLMLDLALFMLTGDLSVFLIRRLAL